MLFNSYIFIFLFLPIALVGFYVLSKTSRSEAKFLWLVVASFLFYGWWNASYLIIILGSIVVNYAVGTVLSGEHGNRAKKLILFLGVTANLGLLGYFKYANFFVDTINQVTGFNIPLDNIVLPLAISFFTFQQVAYLVDAYRGEVKDYDFIHYCLFVTFFPQLIAGPIVHHKEMLPQFIKGNTRSRSENFSIGITIFTIGLFKKAVLADGVSQFVGPAFSSAESTMVMSTFDAWTGALAYTFQLYFDFSGYSDMATGLARMFGIVLPINFNSPYKSKSIIEFWRRWHITLSNFLKEYLYYSLGGNRLGEKRRYINLFLTMLLGGLWHGAGWTFIIWGALHGAALGINHFWHRVKQHYGVIGSSKAYAVISLLLTFLTIIVFWVFFRAETVSGALNIIQAMFGLSPDVERTVSSGSIYWFVMLSAICLWAPNTYQIMKNHEPVLEQRMLTGEVTDKLLWKPSLKWAVIVAILLFWSICTLSSVTEFLYFQF